ncbi:S-layer homology domain-containing protein [Paenibacillus sp. IITD108]|uniref:S-layer homology domain-containing protein n=1 Tax=Paenibacillus sp. IITD108 TaxID=3116649 RepID=UPI002F3ED491
MKKVLSIIVAIALLIGLFPAAGLAPSASAANDPGENRRFNFPNEQYTAQSARIVSTSTIQLQGTIHDIVGNTISYNVKQVTLDDKELNKTEEITTGIQTTGDNRITVSGLILFPGLNKITFTGISGAARVEESIYIEYRDSPMLYDLKVNFENREHELFEDSVTMLYTTQTNTVNQGTIVISGKAPNAQKVTVIINGRSFDFNVSTASSENRFSTSQLTIDPGINTITFKVHNGSQVTETTRQVAFYNGAVTFYDMKLFNTANPSQTTSLTPNLNFQAPSVGAGHISLSGTAIVPLPLYRLFDPANPGDTVTLNKTALSRLISLQLQKGSGAITNVSLSSTNIISYTTDNPDFSTVTFEVELPQLEFDANYNLRIKAPNKTVYSLSNLYNFTVRNNTKAYIHEINYLSGYDKSMSESRVKGLQGQSIPSGGVDVYSMPMAVEVLVGNHTSLSNLNDIFKLNTGINFSQLTFNEVVYRKIDNQQVPFLRVFIEVSKLPKSGTNSITFEFKETGKATLDKKTIIAKLLYGPFVKFDKIVNGMTESYDAVFDSIPSLLTKLGQFKGQLFNVANEDDIWYEDTTSGGVTKRQTVFMYINNVEIPLQVAANQTGTTIKTKFEPKPGTSSNPVPDLGAIINKAGENTLKFVYRNNTDLYESTMKFTIVPKNLPVVPAPDTEGVYPYSTSGQRNPSDPKFTSNGSVYTTKEAEFNVFGTFDFIDLGKETDFNNRWLQLATDRKNYMVVIDSPNWKTPVKWDLSKGFIAVRNDGTEVGRTTENNMVVLESASTVDALIEFYYNVDKEYFYFDIKKQMMPIDGSPQVYVISVFNSGEAGPRATYRMEVNSVSIPYTILAPLPENRITNMNYAEVIIASPGADSIMVGKEQAEKITFINYVAGEEKYQEAFRYVYKNLGANKDTKIPFTITRGKDTIKQELIVKYVPTNIPGAQALQTMAASHKVFNNALTLTFPKNTQLIRPNRKDLDSIIKGENHIYNQHDILFAIANPDDGIINRRQFENQIPNYSAESQATGNLHIGYRFQDQARQYIKASPLFWIDGGLADDPSTAKLDPIKAGMDPFPFYNIVGMYKENFANRLDKFDRELMPSAAGSLTLAYDPNIVVSGATTVTVFRFDPYNSMWENIGGVVDSKKNTITVPFTKFGYYVAVKMTRGYNDITDHPYAREAMEAAFAKGVMNAIDPIGVFGGDRFVTRGEFARMIVRALDIPLNYQGDMHFTYYPETITNAYNASALYDYRYIETLARANIVNGKRPGFFDEDVELSRQEAAVIIARALELKLETNAAKAKTNLDKIFKDSGSFDYYSIPSVIAIEKKGFIQGKYIDASNPKNGSVFEPKARLLRSDAAIIITKVMFDLKKLPKIYN